ncbi:MAG: serine/threonine phosphatase [Cyanobacteria bacterium J06592_8]
MLICPQCQFENPNHHKFCQKCGYALTQKFCGECGATVPLNVLDCPECGARTGTVWLAVVQATIDSQNLLADHVENLASLIQHDQFDSVVQNPQPTQTDQIPTPTAVQSQSEDHCDQIPDHNSAPLEEIVDPVDLESVDSDRPYEEIWISEAFDAEEIPESEAIQSSGDDESIALELEESDLGEVPGLETGAFLDANQRYQLIEPLAALKPGETLTVQVLDTQPLQISPLQAAQPTLQSSPEKMDTFVIAAAQVYLILHSQFPDAFPQVQDGWESDRHSVVLLEDYSKFPTVLEKLRDPEVSLQQIFRWFQEIAELWETLVSLHYRQTLLKLDNLRVSPTPPHQVYIQQLYSDLEESNLSLVDLGRAWKSLVQESQRTLFGSLTQLLQDLNEGEILTTTQLQHQLAKVEAELNATSTASTPTIIATPTYLQVDENEEMSRSLVELESAPTIPRISQLWQLEAIGATDIGRKREQNEDFFGVQTTRHEQQTPQGRILEARGLYILCDGMGGHAGGEVASQLAVDTLKQYFQSQWTDQLPTPEMIEEGILQANRAIYEANQQGVRYGMGRMGTTLVMAIVADNQVAIAHVGDSRLYRFTRSEGMEQITLDHEVGQREIQRGLSPEEAYARPDAYQLTQALGPRAQSFVQPDIQFLQIKEDTLLILASDGLTDNDILETYHTTHLDPLLNPQTDLNIGVNQLIELANEHNGHDNITTIVIRLLVSGV